MGKKLTQAQIERYHRDGFVYPIDALAAGVHQVVGVVLPILREPLQRLPGDDSRPW